MSDATRGNENKGLIGGSSACRYLTPGSTSEIVLPPVTTATSMYRLPPAASVLPDHETRSFGLVPMRNINELAAISASERHVDHGKSQKRTCGIWT